MSNRILDRPRIVDNEIFEGGNGFKALLVQTSGFVTRMSDLNATERYLQSSANHKDDVNLVYLTVGRELDLTTKGLNELSQFFPRAEHVPVLFKPQQQAAMIALRKHDRNIAMCTAITLPTKREPDRFMKDIARFKDLMGDSRTLPAELHEYFMFMDMLAQSNLRLIDRMLRLAPRPRIREFLAARRQQLVRNVSDWHDLAEYFHITELVPD